METLSNATSVTCNSILKNKNNNKFFTRLRPYFPKLFPVLILFVFLALAFSSFAQDPSGANTGTINDVTAASAGKPTVEEVAAQAGHNKIAINIMWTLITGFLVMFMQAGFAMVETGFTQKKNVAHTMAMNFMVYALGILGFWICSFAFMFGGGLNVTRLGRAEGESSHVYEIKDRQMGSGHDGKWNAGRSCGYYGSLRFCKCNFCRDHRNNSRYTCNSF